MDFLRVIISWSNEKFGEEFTYFVLPKVVREGFSRGVDLVQKKWCSRFEVFSESNIMFLFSDKERMVRGIGSQGGGDGEILEGFHLPMRDFICEVLRYYVFALGQLSSTL
ncbi:hypothetical protein PVK06_004673 [Gossypium arboreum]|uniref:Uncharacterized protein n=1 Tax=Gossypium arboreum TaxID=29729 RepID=A0ABR0QTY7_GOSAR|nr:hypothetical protein PVK06_004673 [Gossypium arboreum]